MTRCYRVKSFKIDIHYDYSCKVDGIMVDVDISYAQYMEMDPNDLVVCKFNGSRYEVTRLIKRK